MLSTDANESPNESRKWNWLAVLTVSLCGAFTVPIIWLGHNVENEKNYISHDRLVPGRRSSKELIDTTIAL